MSENYFQYANNQDYINKQVIRAKAIKRCLLVLLIVTAGIYLFFHLWAFDPTLATYGGLVWIPVTNESGISHRALD